MCSSYCPHLAMSLSEHAYQLRVAESHAVVDHLDESSTALWYKFDNGSKLMAGRVVTLAERHDAPRDLGIGELTIWPERHERLHNECELPLDAAGRGFVPVNDHPIFFVNDQIPRSDVIVKNVEATVRVSATR